jgi:hypothetical protein
MAKRFKLPPITRELVLQCFWFGLLIIIVGGTVVLFDLRNADRNLAVSTYGTNLLEATIEEHPDSAEAIQALMLCIQKKTVKMDPGFDEKDINRPRLVCPKYGALLEATHPSPMGMRDLELAYKKIILGLKAKL